MTFEYLSVLSSSGLFSAERNHLNNFKRGSCKTISCEVRWKMASWLQRCHLKQNMTKIFFLFPLAAVLCTEAKPLEWIWKRIVQGTFLWTFVEIGLVVQNLFSIFYCGNHFVQLYCGKHFVRQSGTIWTNLDEYHPRNIPIKFGEKW